jgi:two-component system, sporulation sensor kinase A
MEKDEIKRLNSLLEIYIDVNVDKDFSVLSKNRDSFFILNRSGQLVYVNQMFETLLGYSRFDLLKMKLGNIFIKSALNDAETFFFEKDSERLTNFDSQIFKNQGPSIDVNVTTFPILFNQEVIGSYVVLKDISMIKVERKLKEEREKHFYRLMEQSPESIFILKDMLIVDVNNAGLTLLGAKNKEELADENIYKVIHPGSNEIFKENMNRVGLGNITELYEQKMVRLDGELLNVEVKAFPTAFKNTQAILVLVRDISERKKLSILSEKHAVAGQLAAGIAHEIRNPITAIKGFLQLIMGEHKGEMMYFKIVESEINRIEVILRELMVLAKPSKLKYERLNIRLLLDQVVTLMESQALLNNIQVEKRYNLKDAAIVGDENQLKQVFINFIKNAIEAMPNGGQLLIEGSYTTEKCVQIRIIDQGCGIPNEIAGRIGEPFFTTKENGTGLGMLVSYQIIEEHCGAIKIESDSSGTCIEVNLPVS